MENNLGIINSIERCSVADMAAGYVQLLAQNGRSINAVAASTGFDLVELKGFARKRGFSFCDYDPADKALPLVWAKRPEGWALHRDGVDEPLGECKTSDGIYRACAFGVTVERTKPRAAMALLARSLDNGAREWLGCDNITVEVEGKHGDLERVYPAS